MARTPSRDEKGFTLIELLIAMTISSIIIGAIAGAFIATAANYTASASRLEQSNDAQLLTVWMTADIESAGTGAPNVITTSTTNTCNAPAGTYNYNFVTFTWSDNVTANQTDVAEYWFQPPPGATSPPTVFVLTRYYCTYVTSGSPSAALVHTVGNSVTSSSSITINGQKVTAVIGEPNNTSFTISATRQTQLSLTSLVPSTDSTNGAFSGASIAFNLVGDPCTTSCGTMSFYVFGPQVAAPTNCPTGGSEIGTPVSYSGSGTYNPNASFTPTTPGNYWWYASYSGDSATNNLPLTSACPGSETAVQNTTSFTSISVPSTTVINTSATVKVTLAQSPSTPSVTGTVNFYVSGPTPTAPSACTGSPWTLAGAATVSGGATYSTSTTLTSSGDYWWYASYSGDTSNGPTHTLCPPAAETVVNTTAPTFSITSGQSFNSFPATVIGGAVNNFGANETVSIVDVISGQTLVTSPATLTTNSSGSVTGFSVTVPSGLVGGNHTLQATGATSALSASSDTFTINPTVSFTSGQSFSSLPNTLGGGSGVDFGASDTLTLHLDSAAGQTLSTSISPLTTNASGSTGSFTVTLPSGLSLGTHSVVAVGSSGLSATSNTFTVAPTILSITSANGGGGAAGTLNAGDTITIAFSGQINAHSICSGWTNNLSGTQSTTDTPLLTVTNPGSGDNVMSFASSTGTCPNFNFGTIDLGSANYVTSNGSSHKSATFTNSTVAYNGTAHTLVITLGTVGGSGTENPVSTSILSLALSNSIEDTNNDSLGSYSMTSSSGTQF